MTAKATFCLHPDPWGQGWAMAGSPLQEMLLLRGYPSSLQLLVPPALQDLVLASTCPSTKDAQPFRPFLSAPSLICCSAGMYPFRGC